MGQSTKILVQDIDDPRDKMYVHVVRPDFGKILTTRYDPSGLVAEVKRVFGEEHKLQSNKNKKLSRDDRDEYFSIIEDVCRRALVQPTYEDFEDMLTADHKLSIFHWVIQEARDLMDIIGDKNIAYRILGQANKFDKTPAEILDPKGNLCGITHYLFNNAMFEYLLYVDDKQEPIDDEDDDLLRALQSSGAKQVTRG